MPVSWNSIWSIANCECTARGRAQRAGTAGTANRGGGGGGARFGAVGGAGGSGIVIVQYPTP